MILSGDRSEANVAEVADEDTDRGARVPSSGASSTIRLRHPLEIMPYRPPTRPKWSPRAGSDRARDLVAVEASGWHAGRLRAAADLGAVRVNFVYAAFQSVTASFSEKAGRDQYFEGSGETFGFRLIEVNPFDVDVQYQPITLEWKTATGGERQFTLDYGKATAAGEVVFGEDKASDSFFDDPTTKARLDFVELHLAALGVRLERRVAGGLSGEASRRAVKDVFDARRTPYDENSCTIVIDLVRKGGGVARFGDLVAALPMHDALARDTLFAMVAKRVLAMPFSAPPMPDTPMSLAPVARDTNALRAFLSTHLPQPSTVD